MGKKDPSEQLSEEEILFFRDAMKKIKPIKQSNKVLLKKKPLPRRRTDENIAQEPNKPFLSDHPSQDPVAPDQSLLFIRPGLSPKQIKRLRQGKITIHATLDLHGFDSESAKRELIDFIEFAYKNNKRCISIVHGKGHSDKPVLKNKINNWLRQFDKVLAFCTALPKDGGTGALYVLLKAQK